MPRIRIRKDWTYDENLAVSRDESVDEGSPEQDTDAGGNVSVTGSTEGVSGASYLSNASVIASLPDDRLLSTRSYYASLLALVDEEIRLRRLTGRSNVPIAWPSMFETTSALGRPRRESLRPREPRRAKAKKAKGNQLQLSPQQMIEALQMLLKMKGASNGEAKKMASRNGSD